MIYWSSVSFFFFYFFFFSTRADRACGSAG
jgi:hypothetical protein